MKEAAGRKLDFQLTEGFGDVREADLRAVLTSAAESLWRHCPNTRWEVTGFHVYRSRATPITDRSQAYVTWTCAEAPADRSGLQAASVAQVVPFTLMTLPIEAVLSAGAALVIADIAVV